MSAPTRFAGTTGHPVGEEKTGLAVGMDKGVALTKRALPKKHSYTKGVRRRHSLSPSSRQQGDARATGVAAARGCRGQPSEAGCRLPGFSAAPSRRARLARLAVAVAAPALCCGQALALLRACRLPVALRRCIAPLSERLLPSLLLAEAEQARGLRA